jgi:hypothetical protein
MEDHVNAISTNAAHVPGLAARTLACAVIKQALVDALDPTTPDRIREDAQTFLAGDARYRMWCKTGGYSPSPLLHRHTVA